MKEDVIKFFKDKKIRSIEVDIGGAYSDYYLSKVKLNERFDYLFKGYTNVNLYKYNMEILGLLDNITKKVYVNNTYFMDRDLSEIEYVDLYKLTQDLKNDVTEAYNKYIYDNIESFKLAGIKAFKEYMRYKENVDCLQSKAQERYMDSFILERMQFNFYNKYYGNSDECTTDTQVILEYIVDRKSFIENAIITEIKKENDLISSAVSGVPNIPVTRKEKIGFQLLELEEINRRIMELAKDKGSLFTKKKKIKDILDTEKMKTVNVTVVQEGKTLTFKYPTNQLSRLYIASWYIPDLKTRDLYEKLFNGRYYRDDEIIAKIIKIEYNKKVIYEGNDISNK